MMDGSSEECRRRDYARYPSHKYVRVVTDRFLPPFQYLCYAGRQDPSDFQKL